MLSQILKSNEDTLKKTQSGEKKNGYIFCSFCSEAPLRSLYQHETSVMPELKGLGSSSSLGKTRLLSPLQQPTRDYQPRPVLSIQDVKRAKITALIVASTPLCSELSGVEKYGDIFFFLCPAAQVLWQPGTQQQMNGAAVATAGPPCQPSRFLLFQVSLSLCGLNHDKTNHVPLWSSSAGWSDAPRHEQPSHAPQRQCHATASGEWSTCQWNLPRCRRQGLPLNSVPRTEAIWPQSWPQLWQVKGNMVMCTMCIFLGLSGTISS